MRIAVFVKKHTALIILILLTAGAMAAYALYTRPVKIEALLPKQLVSVDVAYTIPTGEEIILPPVTEQQMIAGMLALLDGYRYHRVLDFSHTVPTYSVEITGIRLIFKARTAYTMLQLRANGVIQFGNSSYHIGYLYWDADRELYAKLYDYCEKLRG